MAVKECGRAAVSPLRGSARDQCGESGARLRQLASPRLASVLLAARFPDQSHCCAPPGRKDAVLVVQSAPCGYAFKTALQTRLALAAS